MAFETILHRLHNRASTSGSAVAYRDKITGSWRETTWAEYDALVQQCTKALMKLGLGEGDVVSIVGTRRGCELPRVAGVTRRRHSRRVDDDEALRLGELLIPRNGCLLWSIPAEAMPVEHRR